MNGLKHFFLVATATLVIPAALAESAPAADDGKPAVRLKLSPTLTVTPAPVPIREAAAPEPQAVTPSPEATVPRPAAVEPARDISGQASDENNEYRLGTGDRIQVTVFGHTDLSGEFEIDGDGRLAMPLIQVVDAAGKTAADLESAIAARLQPDYLRDPRVSVEVLTYRPFYILGEVRRPGSYPYTSHMTLMNAVAVAGGFTYRAARRKMVIIRAGDPERTRMRASEDTIVRPGDVIEIPERFF